MVLHWLSRLFAVQDNTAPASAGGYMAARNALARNDLEARRFLASAAETPPEMLYFLANDGDETVRANVAAHGATPAQAHFRLADDSHESVRAQLARKLARVMPDLPREELRGLRDDTLALLERLARDETAKVRAALAEELAAMADVPRDLVLDLAHDPETEVAAPILEFSPLLNDHDLIEIIAASRARGALSAIARRRDVSEAVSDEIAASLEIPAIATLLANPSARIRDETMERIIDQAREVESLHRPLVMRTDLSVRAMCRIADFVAASLIHQLADRAGLDDETRAHLRARIRDRLRQEKTGGGARDRAGLGRPESDRPASERSGWDKTGADRAGSDRARHLIASAAAQGRLTPDFVENLSTSGDRASVAECLAVLAQAPIETVDRILRSTSAKAITALCWKAGLPMRVAVTIQRKIAQIPTQDMLLARHGTDYPLTQDHMTWHLEFFDID